MTDVFRKLQDVYFDAARLRWDLDAVPTECCCGDAGAHLRGACRCENPSRSSAGGRAQHCVDYRHSLDRLREDVRAFYAGLARGGGGGATGELGWDLNVIEATVGRIGSLVEQLGLELDDFLATCAPKSLLRLKQKSALLERRLFELSNSLSDRSSASGKWLPVRLGRVGRDAAANAASRGFEDRAGAPGTPELLREIVTRHGVCYEVRPEWGSLWGARTQIGYRLELCGVNEDCGTGDSPTPGCPQCHRTYDELRKIAEWVMPKEERPSRYEIEGFDRAWHVAPKQRRSRNEIVLAVKVLHRRGVNEPADECERRCLKEMRVRLEELGVAEGVYRDAQPGAGAAR